MKDTNYFKKKERISWLILVCVIFISLFVPKMILTKKPVHIDSPFSSVEIDSFIQESKKSQLDKIEYKQKIKHQNSPKKVYRKNNWKQNSKIPSQKKPLSLQRFHFDPNHTPDDSMRILLPRYIANNLIKYRSNGGTFKEKTDLLKIYGMDTSLYTSIQPYIIFKNHEIQTSKSNHIERPKEIILIELNEADTAELTRLYGIGSILANRIISFREALGGFHSIGQLAETYGLPEETFLQIRTKFKLDKQHRKIDVNKLDQQSLAAHPYINWKQAKWIEQYRKQHGLFNSIEDMSKIRMLDSNFLAQLAPYFSFQKVAPPEEGNDISMH